VNRGFQIVALNKRTEFEVVNRDQMPSHHAMNSFDYLLLPRENRPAAAANYVSLFGLGLSFETVRRISQIAFSPYAGRR
jgi:hypothetical protein